MSAQQNAVSKFSPGVTSYDLLKAFAILTMIVDHIGYYFFPEELWWRAVGRLSAPAWLFLIGYARSRDISPRLWIGSLILIAASFAFGGAVLPLNILVTILIVRLTIDKIAAFAFSALERMLGVIVLFVLLALPTFLFSDYGAIGYMAALYGYLARQRLEGKKHTDEEIFAGIAGVLYIVMSCLIFTFNPAQQAVVIAGGAFLFSALYFFRPVAFGGILNTPFKGLAPVLRFLGTRTLEIYVFHIVLFRFIAVWLEIEPYGFFDWTLL